MDKQVSRATPPARGSQYDVKVVNLAEGTSSTMTIIFPKPMGDATMTPGSRLLHLVGSGTSGREVTSNAKQALRQIAQSWNSDRGH